MDTNNDLAIPRHKALNTEPYVYDRYNAYLSCD